MRISAIRSDSLPDGSMRVSARLDAEEVYFVLPPGHAPGCHLADPFVTVGLLPAMFGGAPLVVEGPHAVSRPLYERLAELQDIFAEWNPLLTKVAIQATTAEPQAARDEVGAFFSRGVDSSYTLLKHRDEITHLAFMSGFDFPDGSPQFQAAREQAEAFANALGKVLVTVSTNHKALCRSWRISTLLSHGAHLASVAQLFGFRRMRIPASHTYAELFPWGSHPLTDPMWSNGTTDIVHSDAVRRSRKVEALAAEPEFLARLRVCTKDQRENCGRCYKCVRVMTALGVLGVRGPFPRGIDPDTASRVFVPDVNELTFLIDNHRFAVERGHEPLARATRRALRRYDRRRALVHLDRGHLGGWMRRLHQWLKPEPNVALFFVSPRPDVYGLPQRPTHPWPEEKAAPVAGAP